jgi:hypothetical protein
VVRISVLPSISPVNSSTQPGQKLDSAPVASQIAMQTRFTVRNVASRERSAIESQSLGPGEGGDGAAGRSVVSGTRSLTVLAE